ncbi:hypothetical protein [Salinifilum aidingensis]
MTSSVLVVPELDRLARPVPGARATGDDLVGRAELNPRRARW